MTSIAALLLYAAWTLGLVATIAGLRTFYSLAGRHRANRFSPAGDDVSAFSGRLCRAHANCYENLPIFGAVVLVAVATENTLVTDPLAPYAVAARIAQSSVHLRSTRVRAVAVRFVFFAVQLAIVGYWTVALAFATASA